MSTFTAKELEYLEGQSLGRLATVRPDGTPQIAPVGYHYNAELDVIDIAGRYMSQTKKFRNIADNPNVSLVIDDFQPPQTARGVEIRGVAQIVPTGASAVVGAAYPVDETFIRITPRQIIGWGLDPEFAWSNNRKVGAERSKPTS